jgi:hypothetical protein
MAASSSDALVDAKELQGIQFYKELTKYGRTLDNRACGNIQAHLCWHRLQDVAITV